MSTLKTIGVIGDGEVDDSIQILTALANCCGLNLRRAGLDEAGTLKGIIFVGTTSGNGNVSTLKGCSSIHVLPAETTAPAAYIRFNTGPASPFPYRGRSLGAECVVPRDLSNVSAEVIAAVDGRPVWTTQSRSGLRYDKCWVSRPWIKTSECAFDHLNGNRFMNLLPVLEWMRSISGWHEWKHPPLQACFLFDDPNLHSTRYGFLKFAELAAEGRRHHYHTAFATVPLDGYYVSPAAARILRDNRETLSLLIHGNNHTPRELAARRARSEQLALIQQAMVRIGRLEKRGSVAVSRVMAPPHGICSAEMMAAMVDAGVEAACVSHGSVWTGNQDAGWTASLGTLPATIIAGLPVIPRFGLDHQPENKVLLAAYLRQPIIPVGHHWDLAEGTEILSSAANLINGLGSVAWGSLTAITRSNYRSQIRGPVMRVHTFSRVMTVDLPDGISEVEVETNWLDSERETLKCPRADPAAPSSSSVEQATMLRFQVTPGTRIELAVARKPVNDETQSALPRTPLRVICRKVLVELRDRCMPFFPRSLRRR